LPFAAPTQVLFIVDLRRARDAEEVRFGGGKEEENDDYDGDGLDH